MDKENALREKQINKVMDLLDGIQLCSANLQKRIENELSPYMRPELQPAVQNEQEENVGFAPAIQSMLTKLNLIEKNQISIILMLDRLEI